jgi:hypothetical protein
VNTLQGKHHPEGKVSKSQAAIRPVAEDLHKKLSASYRTAVESVLDNAVRWEPPQPMTDSPTDQQLLASRGFIRPDEFVSPSAVWAAPYSVMFHRLVPSPTFRYCFSFTGLSDSGIDGYLCVSKDSHEQQA